MHKFILGAVALTTLAVAQPAAAAQLRVDANEPGISVRVGRDHDHYRAYAREPQCKEVTVRTKRANGTVVVKKIQKCR